ncbi:uncharacterized protein TNCV_1563001 [Trichonephila clavipes]|nr:uncharacterized protein TNCV_1563001 [Trichonephila clavipes]
MAFVKFSESLLCFRNALHWYVLVAVSFPRRRNESCQSLSQIGLLYDRWRNHLSSPSQFRYGTGGEGSIAQPPVLVVSAATAHKTVRPTDLTSTYSMCTWRVFGGIGH